MLAAATAGLEVAGYSPLSIKSAVVGYGRAEKHQVQQMVTRLLNLDQIPEPATPPMPSPSPSAISTPPPRANAKVPPADHRLAFHSNSGFIAAYAPPSYPRTSPESATPVSLVSASGLTSQHSQATLITYRNNRAFRMKNAAQNTHLEDLMPFPVLSPHRCHHRYRLFLARSGHARRSDRLLHLQHLLRAQGILAERRQWSDRRRHRGRPVDRQQHASISGFHLLRQHRFTEYSAPKSLAHGCTEQTPAA